MFGNTLVENALSRKIIAIDEREREKALSTPKFLLIDVYLSGQFNIDVLRATLI